MDIPTIASNDGLTPKQIEIADIVRAPVYAKIYYGLIMQKVHRNDWDGVYNAALWNMLQGAESRMNDSNLHGWCYKIVLNTIKDHHKTHGKKQKEVKFTLISQMTQELVSLLEQPDYKINQSEALSKAWELIEALPPHYGVPFFFHHYHSMSPADIADMMEIPERTAQYQIQKAKEILNGRAQQYLVYAYGLCLSGNHIPTLSQQVVETFVSEAAIGAAAAGAAASLSGSKLPSAAGASAMGVLAYAGLPILWVIALFTGGYHAAHALVQDAPTLPVRRWTVIQLIILYSLLACFPVYFLAAHFFTAHFLLDYQHNTYVTGAINWVYFSIITFYLCWVNRRKKRLANGEQCNISDDRYQRWRLAMFIQLTIISCLLIVGCILLLNFVFVPRIATCYQQGNWLVVSLAALLIFMMLTILTMHFGTYALFNYFFKISYRSEGGW